jgi:hypothetical protein
VYPKGTAQQSKTCYGLFSPSDVHAMILMLHSVAFACEAKIAKAGRSGVTLSWEQGPLREAGKLRGVTDDILGVIVALIISGIAAVFATLLGVVTGAFLGGLLFRIGLTTDEGAAWSGMSLGIPIGLVFAIIAFVYCFRKFTASGQPE